MRHRRFAFVRILWDRKSWLPDTVIVGGSKNNTQWGSFMPDFSSSPPRCGAVAFAALASLFLLVAPLDQALADKPSTPVTVTNPATSPVPTTVTNPSTSPALTSSVDDPARHPFTTSCSSAISQLRSASCSTTSIPAGEEVVIETISFSANADPGNSALFVQVETVAAGNDQIYPLNNLFDIGIEQPVLALFAGAQALRLYADPGSVISCFSQTKELNLQKGLRLGCAFSGYSVKLP
jgi:hypothetical protein